MSDAIRWKVHDHFGNEIYLTQERWEHIIDAINHPEFIGHEEELKKTIRQGARKQDPLNPQKIRYTKAFDNLPMDNTHVVVIVLYRYREQAGQLTPNNYVVTAYQVEID
jgi:hypothetical protein